MVQRVTGWACSPRLDPVAAKLDERDPQLKEMGLGWCRVAVVLEWDPVFQGGDDNGDGGEDGRLCLMPWVQTWDACACMHWVVR
jgi:hypothetical protein